MSLLLKLCFLLLSFSVPINLIFLSAQLHTINFCADINALCTELFVSMSATCSQHTVKTRDSGGVTGTLSGTQVEFRHSLPPLWIAVELSQEDKYLAANTVVLLYVFGNLHLGT